MTHPMAEPWLAWKKGVPPKDKPGHYLVQLTSRQSNGSDIQTYTVKKAANGYLALVGMYFDYDILDKDTRIEQWCEIPEPNRIA